MTTKSNTTNSSKVGQSPAAKKAAAERAAARKTSAPTASATKRRTPRHVAAKAKQAEKAAAAKPSEDQLQALVDAVTTALAAPGVITGRLERNATARTEGTALKAWTEGGEKGKRPATPNADLVAAHYAARQAGAKVPDLPDTTTPRAPKEATGPTATKASGTTGAKAAPVGTNAKSGTPRLAPGALNDVVLAHLAANAGVAMGPSQVAKAIDRSSGAVAKALVRMAAAGDVRQVGKTPLRYQATKASGSRKAPSATSGAATAA